jgi:hypothetical protein
LPIPKGHANAGDFTRDTRCVVVRVIEGFHQDDAGDWVAELSCRHNQHVRHKPPFQQRPWVMSPEGRRQRIGTAIECPLCDRAE